MTYDHLWWNIKESNLEPPGYEPDALTSCANVPYYHLISVSALTHLLTMGDGCPFRP